MTAVPSPGPEIGAAIHALRAAGFELTVLADDTDDAAVLAAAAPGTGRVDR